VNFLDEVARAKRAELNDIAELISRCGTRTRPYGGQETLCSLSRARGTGRPFIVAEVKKSSPSKGAIAPQAPVAEVARAFEEAGASAVSVLTERTWFGGSYDDLRAVCERVTVPVLNKDFVIDERQIDLAAILGADLVLLIADLLKDRLEEFVRACRARGLEPLVEARSAREIDRARECGARIIGVNSRDLRSLDVDRNVFARLSASVRVYREEAFFIAESGIRSEGEVVELLELGYDGMLIGERLMAASDGCEFLERITHTSRDERTRAERAPLRKE
jgi:indole-3-glycerol phosphate synthase